MSEYQPPKVWTWDADSGGKWASQNRPIAGPTHNTDLPVGEHPYQLYSMGTPNGQKATIMFEELLEAGHPAEYDAWLIDISEGDLPRMLRSIGRSSRQQQGALECPLDRALC